MKLHFTLGYHLEGDGQTECVNQTLEQYLQIYCNFQQDNWLLQLQTMFCIKPVLFTKSATYESGIVLVSLRTSYPGK
jgi:hypothetical protein